MNELLEFLETLKSIQALPEPMQPAAVDRAVEKYEQEVIELDRQMSAQHDLFFSDTPFQAPTAHQKKMAELIEGYWGA